MNEDEELGETIINPLTFIGTYLLFDDGGANGRGRGGRHYEFQDDTDFLFQTGLQYDFQGA